ncbi:coagulation factor 5/8 type domain-containing protein [Aquisphaera insulae]|uniref:coagulation factor 5/8 type domain-containing protein n=1 Tax=Aquisphaera insulae TaxID=2712864 RepID=UPI0013EC89B2|nr:coagulation factor 5/8 type domain-containing protein [Aquisphaera insulae]
MVANCRNDRFSGRPAALVAAAVLAFGSCLLLVTPAPAEEPDLGPNVLILDPSMPSAEIQKTLNAVFHEQEHSQFGGGRHAYLFKPGTYDLDVNLGFYTQALGLGTSPGDVVIRGSVHSEADWMRGNATCTFWRGAENLTVQPTSPTPINFAVSQGTSFRRVHVHGHLNLWDGGWSSGGFLADSRVDGRVNSGTQQQWLSRNTEWRQWLGANWNMVFVGADNPPTEPWPGKPYTVISETPRIREKPYMVQHGRGGLAVRVPALVASASRGVSWSGGEKGGETVSIERFLVAQAGKDTAATMNSALANGKHLLLTPGVYHLDEPIQVTRPGTVVLGLGIATLVPDRGTPAMVIDDVDGASICGIMIDAGRQKSPVLLQVGRAGKAGHSTNPTLLADVFCRVGGASPGAADACLVIDSDDVIGDNLWIWRADHGAGAKWDVNRAKNGLIVNGDDVTIYGLFVEHFQEYQTLWNGENGRVFFYQCELPYDAPTQEAWRHDGVNGYAAYKVASGVTRHEARGLGVYGVFLHSPTKSENAIEAPEAPGVAIHHVISVWITGRPGTEITHIRSGKGPAVNTSRRTALTDD